MTTAASDGGPDREARQAIALALAYLPSQVTAADDYRLIKVENLLVGEDASQARWAVGFKLRSIIPTTDDGKIGKGGDVYLEVNTTTGQVQPLKGGH